MDTLISIFTFTGIVVKMIYTKSPTTRRAFALVYINFAISSSYASLTYTIIPRII